MSWADAPNARASSSLIAASRTVSLSALDASRASSVIAPAACVRAKASTPSNPADDIFPRDAVLRVATNRQPPGRGC